QEAREELFEVIGRADIGGAFDRASGCAPERAQLRTTRVREVAAGVIGAELVVPVAVADLAIPDTGLAPPPLRDVDSQPVVGEDFRFGEGGVDVPRCET